MKIIFNTLLLKNLIIYCQIILTVRPKQANLPTKNNIANIAKKADFDDKVKILNKNVTWNKIKQVMVVNEVN